MKGLFNRMEVVFAELGLLGDQVRSEVKAGFVFDLTRESLQSRLFLRRIFVKFP